MQGPDGQAPTVIDFGTVGDFTGVFTIWDIVIVLCLSFSLSLIIGKVYQVTHKGISYSQGNVQTYVLMAVVVAVIMLVIGSNIARAFSLVGALSIVRFRNAVKESRDVGFVFWAMAVGMACGTRFYLMAVFATIVIVITSSGIPASPMTPRTTSDESRLGKIAMSAMRSDRKRIRNITKSASTVNPIV